MKEKRSSFKTRTRKSHAKRLRAIRFVNRHFAFRDTFRLPKRSNPISDTHCRSFVHTSVVNFVKRAQKSNWASPIPSNIIEKSLMRIFSWQCSSCHLINFPLNTRCADPKCNSPRPGPIPAWLVGNALDLIKWRDRMTDKNQLDKHVKFYNAAKIRCSELTFEQKEEWLFKLEEIIFQAKSEAMAVVDSRKEDIVRMTKQERDKLLNPDWIPPTSRLVTDSAQTVKRTSERRTTAQKTAESMRNLGLDEAEIKRLFGTISVTDKGNNKSTFNDKPALLAGNQPKVNQQDTQQDTHKSSTEFNPAEFGLE